CNDGFDNDALQLKDCELATLTNTKDMPGVGSAEYDCETYCRANVLNTEVGANCDNNKDDDFDAVIVTGYYSGTENTAFGAGTDCRWLTYNPDEDCNLTTLSSGKTCELGHELTCNDLFDNDYDADGTSADHPSPGWTNLTYFNTFGVSLISYADYDDYDCATNLPYAQNESLNASWCFDGIDNDMDMYYWNGSSWILNSSTGIDCKDPDCMGITNPNNTNQTCMEKEYDPADLFFQGLAIPGMYCTNSFDDDADNALGWPLGGMDCRDPDCNKQFDICSQTSCYNSEAAKWDSCTNGLDDDYDMPTSIIDCKDTDCLGMIGDLNGALCQSTETTCDDGFDNDADSQVDCEESYCINKIGGKINGINIYCRAIENSSSDCFDGFDNDGDGNIDCYDSSCNSECNLTNINGNNPISLPAYSGQITLNSIDQSTQARIDQSTEQVRDGEYYNITFRGIAASTNAQWTIGTATSRFEKTNFDIPTAALSGTNAGTFSLTSTANGWIVQSTAGHPGGYVVTFRVKTNGTFSSATYELTYAETNGGLISLNNYLDYETNENISPIANSIQIIPNSGNLIQNETIYIRANISDNYNLGRCHFVVSGAEDIDLGTSNDCKDSFNPINEGIYYINVTPIDYYGNIGTDLREQYDLNLMPKAINITLDRTNPFYNQSIDVVQINATFEKISGDTLGTCEVIAINSSNTEISLGTFAASGNNCLSSSVDISPLSNGEYRVIIRVTETTEGDIIESETISLFACSQTTTGVCRFADYNSDNLPDVCDIVKNVTVTLLNPLDNFDTNETEINFSCYAESNDSLVNVTLYVWNSTGDVFYSYVNPIFGTNDTSNWTTTLSNGNYSWNCLAYNNQSQSGWSDVNRTITANYIVEYIDPVVSLISPADGYSGTSTTMTFIYQVNDSSNIANCSLFVDDIREETDTTVTKGINQQFITNLGIGVYNWKVVCYDEFNNQGNSTSRQITIKTTTDSGSGGVKSGNLPITPPPALKICWPEVNNETLNAEIGKKDLGVERITFFYGGYAINPCLIVEGIPIEEITSKTNYAYENSYKSFKITTEVFEESKIRDIKIVTSLTNSWLILRDLNSLRLNRNTEIKMDGWETYFANLVNRDPGYSYFESEVRGFSIFLSTVNLKAPPMCGNHVCESDLGETQENCCIDCGCIGQFNRCSKNQCVEDWTWLILLLLIFLAIFSAYKLHKHMRNKKKFS
ncbi:hypothetical protein J4465_02820, partial [Candidatus Pacearchaeota archaeon]|nr:hypothetical protein [Candidatus Pacearchaeota archaeon]